ncbi:hypothetical protein M9H77_29407 [Catharanthus roseus]|uniref:Uncharacterized protein n=1 Tax=Catharanthus roseus TaxID=4058 RepID=A0ACB9ZW63_CATRO|nr:hypothetical protein M9H77_29407 [Catharanthus roseus]
MKKSQFQFTSKYPSSALLGPFSKLLINHVIFPHRKLSFRIIDTSGGINGISIWCQHKPGPRNCKKCCPRDKADNYKEAILAYAIIFQVENNEFLISLGKDETGGGRWKPENEVAPWNNFEMIWNRKRRKRSKMKPQVALLYASSRSMKIATTSYHRIFSSRMFEGVYWLAIERHGKTIQSLSAYGRDFTRNSAAVQSSQTYKKDCLSSFELLRNKDATVHSRERKKMFVKDLEMKSRYHEADCSILEWMTVDAPVTHYKLPCIQIIRPLVLPRSSRSLLCSCWAHKDATQVVNLQRQQVHSRLVACDYLEANIDLMDTLIIGCGRVYDQLGEEEKKNEETVRNTGSNMISNTVTAERVTDHLWTFLSFTSLGY